MKLSSLFTTTLCLLGSCTIQENHKFTTSKPVEHVFIIGLDGFSAAAVRNGVEMPALRGLMAEGAYTLEARSILPSSSAANWASMFMGASSEIHGYNTWGSKVPDFPSRVVERGGIFPNIFGEVRDADANAEIGLAYEWGTIKNLTDTTAFNSINQYASADGQHLAIVDSSLKYIKEQKPNLFVISFDQPDGAGHKYGWSSKEYLAKLTQLDGYIAQFIDAIKQAGIADRSLVIVTSDHGGIGNGHGGITMDEMQIPVVLWGAGVKPNHRIEESVMIYDVAATVLSAKHIEQPQVWIGRAISGAFLK